MSDIKYPNVKVKLVGIDGNAFSILGNVQRAMKRAGLTTEQIAEFNREAMGADYNHLLATCMRYVDVR